MVSSNKPPGSLETLDSAVRIAIYAEFVSSSRAPHIDDLAGVLRSTQAEIEASLRRLADAHLIVLDEDNRIRMAMPFSAVPTPFRVTTAQGAWFANCAWDALGIPVALATDARIDTSCADCGEAISLEVRSGKLVNESGVIHFAVPAAHWWDNIRFT